MKLIKFEGNPILTPHSSNDWENLVVEGSTLSNIKVNVGEAYNLDDSIIDRIVLKYHAYNNIFADNDETTWKKKTFIKGYQKPKLRS